MNCCIIQPKRRKTCDDGLAIERIEPVLFYMNYARCMLCTSQPICTYTLPEDCLVRRGGPYAVQARDEFQKRLGSVWNFELNCGLSSIQILEMCFWADVQCWRPRHADCPTVHCGSSARQPRGSPARLSAEAPAMVSSAVCFYGFLRTSRT